MTGVHVEAVRGAVDAAGGRLTAVHRPVVELCLTLAAQMDAAGGEPSTRLSAAYLSGLKDLGRALSGVPAGQPRALDELRAKRARRVMGG